ncbi:MAG: carnitine 3-dehydrogenase [Pseudomonadota bacterium]|nr:carnitine 3-dehydrogenase [Pseudomonadota bacterium]
MIAIRKAAAIGGGVIGGGWISRLLLAGVDVAVFDPHPDAQRLIGEVLANAERAYGMLTAAPLPPRGELTFAPTLEAAVSGADFIQESVPERLELKRSVIEAIDRAAPAEALIGSSTSGLLPSDLQANMRHPGRLVVAHPYNPVYLLPLVELVGGKLTSPETIARVKIVYSAIGMKAVHIAREIEAFVGDRLLETLWREALWLIKDDICDVETLDDVIRYSFGLRWAQMGLFQTYRIAGGEAGMRHFLAQFGPCLAWPWSKLTDVPDLDDALVEKIAAQSDAQARGLGIRQLERIRDENLVGILHALMAGDGGKGWGAGLLLKDFERDLWSRAKADAAPEDLSQPIVTLRAKVNAAWIDYNGHMTEFRYLQVLGDASDGFLRLIGVDAETAAAGSSYYTVETHIRHLKETKLGEPLRVETTVIRGEGKKLHLFHRIIGEATGALHATGEHLLLHVSGGQSSLPPAHVAETLARYVSAHARLPAPDGAGRAVGVRTPK